MEGEPVGREERKERKEGELEGGGEEMKQREIRHESSTRLSS